MNIGSMCTRLPETTSRLDSVRHAATQMAGQDVGSLIVTDNTGRPEGIVTDRDIVVRCIAEGLGPDDTPVKDVMTDAVTTVLEGASVEDALALMADQEVRRLVVVADDGRIAGIVTLDDMLSRIVDQADEVGRLLRGQVQV
jgi:CBS domain-containing protein